MRPAIGIVITILGSAVSTEAFADPSSPAIYAWTEPGSGSSHAAQPPYPGRSNVTAPTIHDYGDGVYDVTVANGAPLPGASGLYTSVTAVGTNNVRCFEWNSWVAANGNDWVSEIICTDTVGNGAPSPFSWFYRTDNLSHPQTASYRSTFAYAGFQADSSGIYALDGRNFNPRNQSPTGITYVALGVGQYKVTFKGLGAGPNWKTTELAYVDAHCIDYCYNIACGVQDFSSAVADPYVTIQCKRGGNPIDAWVQVAMGQEGINEGVLGAYGVDYAWGVDASSFNFRNRTERPDSPPNPPPYLGPNLTVTRNSAGRYHVDILNHTIYENQWTFQVASAPGRYCKLDAMPYNNQTNPTPGMDISCYNLSGSHADSTFYFSEANNPH